MSKKILIVVDMQNDFVTGALGTKEAQAIVPAVVKKIREVEAGTAVIATLDTHEENYMQTREGRFLPVPHCIRGTEGWQIVPEIAAVLPQNTVFVEKPTFGSVNLPDVVRGIVGEENPGITLIGVCTDICVVSNALLLKAAFLEDEFAVDAACCAGVTPEKHEAALETMRSCQIMVY